jgi:hypothetical protein
MAIFQPGIDVLTSSDAACLLDRAEDAQSARITMSVTGRRGDMRAAGPAGAAGIRCPPSRTITARPSGSWMTPCPADRTCHLDRGYDSTVTRQLLDEPGLDGQVARQGVPPPIQADTTGSWSGPMPG